MATPSHDVMEMVLRECDTAGGAPWYPTEYARITGIDRDAVDEAVDELRVGNLIEITEWVSGKGQGYVITEMGREVLQRPRLLQRLRKQGVPTLEQRPRRQNYDEEGRSWDRGQAIQAALMTPSPPRMTMVLLAINVVFFVYGWMEAQKQNVSDPYLFGGNKKVLDIRHDTGALWTRSGFVTPTWWVQGDVQAGRWWRLVSNCFVHHGLLHIGINMYALFVLGPLSERFWGRFRFVVLYLLSGVAGSAFAVLLPGESSNPTLLAGASGAICGLLGAMIPWVLLNRRYLPRDVGSSMLRSALINVLLITFLSVMISYVSWQGHLGGGVAGAVLAVALNFSRFGVGSQRMLGWVGVVVLPVVFGVYFVSAVGPSEIEYARAQYLPKMKSVRITMDKFHTDLHVWTQKKVNEKPVTQEETKKLLATLGKADDELKPLPQLLQNEKYNDPRLNQAVTHMTTYVKTLQAYYRRARDLLSKENVSARNWQSLLSNHTAQRNAWDVLRESVLFPTE